jgi:hypothetical protein
MDALLAWRGRVTAHIPHDLELPPLPSPALGLQASFHLTLSPSWQARERWACLVGRRLAAWIPTAYMPGWSPPGWLFSPHCMQARQNLWLPIPPLSFLLQVAHGARGDEDKVRIGEGRLL